MVNSGSLLNLNALLLKSLVCRGASDTAPYNNITLKQCCLAFHIRPSAVLTAPQNTMDNSAAMLVNQSRAGEMNYAHVV